MHEEEVHIAVGKNSRKEKLNILWSVANFPRAAIVLVHVHWPSKWMPFMGGRLLYKFADEMEKEKHRNTEMAAMVNMLSKYKSLCGTRKVRAYYLTHHNTIAGVVNLVKNLKIKRIIIGSRNMTMQDVLSRMCQVWVVLSGKHISTSKDPVEHNRILGEGGSSSYFGTIQERALKCKEQIRDKLLSKLKLRQQEGCGSHGEDKLSQRKLSASLKENNFCIPEHVDQFTTSQIRKATRRLSSKNLIGQGGYGPVYKGNLGGMPVAIKILKPRGSQGFPEFLQEMVVLSRLEHPHIVKLIGVCPESCSLVYEHLCNGTLLDRLKQGGLQWEDRIRILTEQRSALVYLHSSRPNAIIHADLKLNNILLDAGDVSRLGDFGTARVVPVKPLEEETIIRRTVPMGTMGYIDPVFLMTGKLTTASDVYAFGVVILQLLTGLDDLNIVEQVRVAVKMHAVNTVLDPSAGTWPKKPTGQLLKLALRCCSWERKRRPAITSKTKWRSLHTLRAMSTSANKTQK